MDLKKIEFTKREDRFNPTAMIIRGEYRLSMELTTPTTEWEHSKNEAKKLIHDSIERQASHDIMGASFARNLNEEARQAIVGALVYANNDCMFMQDDIAKKTDAYKAYKFREQLLYELRSMKI